MAKVMLDPGHGGAWPDGDSGSVAHGSREADITLAVAWLAYQRLLDAGLEVAMTRQQDTPVELARRAEMANAYGADVYVSIHCNAFKDASAHGTETLIRANEYKALQADDDLAKIVQRHMVAALGRQDRGVKVQNLGMLRGANMPCCLVELCFITNVAEHALLVSPDGQQRAAEAIADAVLEFLGLPEPAEPVPDVRVMVDGEYVPMQAEIRDDDRVWVRLRDLELLGWSVGWDGETRVVRLDKPGY